MTEASNVAVDGSAAKPDPNTDPNPIDVSLFAPTLIAWQREHGRHALPWQQFGAERDAYRVWLAEIMLQQTQVAAVVPYYRRFVERFPTVEALASASTDDVMQQWSGLGYYSRARNLHAAARRVVDDFGGRFPDTVAALESLPGIGRSTAGAIVAFAYGKSAAILDGNVKRVLARIFLVEEPTSDRATTQRLWALSEALLPRSHVERDIGRYTQGLMDLGATVCTPRNPACLICPFETTCLAHREGREGELPRRALRRAPPSRTGRLLLVTRGDEVLLQRRPAIGIWGGLWSLPEISFDADDDAVVALAAQAGAQHGRHYGEVASISERPGFVHGFTHFVLHASVVHIRLMAATSAVESPDDATRWVAFDALGSLGLPTPVRRLLSRADIAVPTLDR